MADLATRLAEVATATGAGYVDLAPLAAAGALVGADGAPVPTAGRRLAELIGPAVRSASGG